MSTTPEAKNIVDNATMENKRDSFTDQIQSLLKDKSHKVVAFVPLESSNLNRCRHLVILRAPSDNTSKHAKHKWYGLTNNAISCGVDLITM